MSYFLAFDCSMPLASVSLLKNYENSFKLLTASEWTHTAFKTTHSDKLVLEIEKLLKKTKIQLEELKGLAVGAGPGRFTGVRAALTTAKALSFSLKIPVYPVQSLKILAEEFYKKTALCFVAIYAFKNQVYFLELFSQTEKLAVLTFEQWKEKMESYILMFQPRQILCVSDLDKFYQLDPHLKTAILFKEPKVSAFNLAQIVLREKVQPRNWSELKAYYLRSAL